MTSYNTSKKMSFSLLLNVNSAGAMYSRFAPRGWGCNSGLILISTRSFWAFRLSFVLPLIPNNVNTTLSVTFFSICITSRLWRIKLCSQYGNSKKILFFFQLNLVFGNALFVALAISFSNCSLALFRNTSSFLYSVSTLRLLNCCKTYDPVNLRGSGPLLTLPLNANFFVRNLWSGGKNWRWPQ